MTTNLILDEAGRVVLPEQLREELGLSAGDTIELESEGDQITLRPVRPAKLKQKQGVWVFEGPAPSASIPDLIDRMREQRSRDILG